jgi:hypothetical protein
LIAGTIEVSNHLSKDQIDRYHQRSLSPAEIVSVCSHLESCEDCREETGGEDRRESAFLVLGAGIEGAADRDSYHLSPEQSVAYVTGHIDEIDADIVESHVENCQSCAGELRDLRAFEFQTGEQRAGYATRATDADPSREVKHSWLAPIRWRVVQAAALVLLVTLLVMTIWLQNRVRGLSVRVDELEALNHTLRQEIASLSGSKNETQPFPRAEEESPNPNGEVAVELNDGGGLVTLDREGVLSGLVAMPARYERILKRMLTTGEAPIPSGVTGLAGKPETMMGTPEARQVFRLIQPVGVVVLEDRPGFRWTSLEGASAYTVDVFDSESKRVATSGELQLTQWTPARGLEQDRTYIWEVTAIKDGKEVVSPAPPTPQARFKVLDRASVDELESARRRYPSSHLLLGGIFAQAGLLDDAEREFKALLSANPNSTIARRLLQSVQAPRR